MVDKAYMIFGTVLCIFFFYASQSGLTILAWSNVGHTKGTGPGLHHK